MGLLRKFFSNTGKPQGTMGKIVVAMMNRVHAGIAAWGFSHLDLQGSEQVLDCGCGGGANIAVFLRMVDEGHVTGQGNVQELPFDDSQFDVVTAFETVYFWPEIARCFAQVHRVLKPGGMFMITNETSGKTKSHEKWLKIVDGMSVYTGEELESLLRGAGFARVEIDEDLAHDRLNVRAYKA